MCRRVCDIVSKGEYIREMLEQNKQTNKQAIRPHSVQ